MQRVTTLLGLTVLLGAAALLIWGRIGSPGEGARDGIAPPAPQVTLALDRPRQTMVGSSTASSAVSEPRMRSVASGPLADTRPEQVVFASPLAASVRTPLHELLAAAQASSSRQRGGVLTVASLACRVSRHLPTDTDEGLLARALRFFQGLDDAAIRIRTADVEAAKATLGAWCRDYDERALTAAARDIHRADGRPPVSVTSPLKPDSPWRDVQRQYIEQVLLNPQVNREEFGLWLELGMAKQVPMVAALSWEQQYLLRDLLYQSLTGAAPDPLSIRSLQACVLLKWCPSSAGQMSASAREEARQVAEKVVTLIRSQRLNELLHWPGG